MYKYLKANLFIAPFSAITAILYFLASDIKEISSISLVNAIIPYLMYFLILVVPAMIFKLVHQEKVNASKMIINILLALVIFTFILTMFMYILKITGKTSIAAVGLMMIVCVFLVVLELFIFYIAICNNIQVWTAIKVFNKNLIQSILLVIFSTILIFILIIIGFFTGNKSTVYRFVFNVFTWQLIFAYIFILFSFFKRSYGKYLGKLTIKNNPSLEEVNIDA